MMYGYGGVCAWVLMACVGCRPKLAPNAWQLFLSDATKGQPVRGRMPGTMKSLGEAYKALSAADRAVRRRRRVGAGASPHAAARRSTMRWPGPRGRLIAPQ